jgi:GT2 family glycosyltransferase
VCLSALLSIQADVLAEVVVVDNASEDNTCALVAQYRGARLVRHSKNKGFAAGVNTGVASTTGDYVLVLNPDVIITAEAITALTRDLHEDETFAAVGCQMIYPDGRNQASARRFPTIAGFVERALLTNHIARRLHISCKCGQWNDFTHNERGISQVDWVLGGCMLIRRLAYNAIGPLDEKYFLYYEDIDWCYRARLDNWKIGFSSNAQVIHAYKRSSSRLSFTNRLTWVHLSSVCHFFFKFAAQRGIKTVF